MLNKYKYHHKVLAYLNNRWTEYLEQIELNKTSNTKVLRQYTFNAKEISNDLNIDLIKTNATLLDLTELGLLEFKDFRYSLKENAISYIDAKYFEAKKYEYNKNKFFDYAKNILIIILGLFSIYTFVISQKNQDTPCKQKLIEMQESINNIQAEQDELRRIQYLILTDSIYRKND